MSRNYLKRDTLVSEAALSQQIDTDCNKVCEGFISCSENKVEQNRIVFLKNACFAGCNKQIAIISKCSGLIEQKKCNEAILCLQTVMSGNP